MSRNLVLVRAGDDSLHPSWLKAEGNARNWDMHISYFGKRRDPFGDLPDGTSISYDSGPKYIGLSNCLKAHPRILTEYDFIATPDDDLQFVLGNWTRAFELAKEFNAYISQPSLDLRSFWGHSVTLQRRRYTLRQVNFVEVMCPIFSRNALCEFHKYFTMNNSSWGIDHVWSQIAHFEGNRLFIFDDTAMLHTRRIGNGPQYGNCKPPLQQHMIETLADHGFKTIEGQTLRCIYPNRQPNGSVTLANFTPIEAQLWRLFKYAMKVSVLNV